MGYLDKDGLQHYHAALQPSLVRGVTQAEYDLLTEEQKKGLFVITDAQSGDSGTEGDTSGGNCENVYSTEETRIGTWIDGKPLYRKVSEGVVPSTAGSPSLLCSIPAIDTLVFAYGRILRGSIERYKDWVIPNATINLLRSDGGVYMMTSDKSYSNQTAVVIALYTKTTDEAVIG